MIKYPVIYVTKAMLRAAHVSLEGYPNAGPNPNVTGMRRLYWGNDAPLLKHGQYVYKVDTNTYCKFGGMGSANANEW